MDDVDGSVDNVELIVPGCRCLTAVGLQGTWRDRQQSSRNSQETATETAKLGKKKPRWLDKNCGETATVMRIGEACGCSSGKNGQETAV